MKRRIVLLGPPASGKGTQASLIEERYGIPITSPGAMLREEKRNGTALGIKADELTSRGKLLPDQIIVNLVRAWLEKRNSEFVFDGFPRSLGQAEALEGLLSEGGRPLDVVIALDVDVRVLEERVASRLMCENCGRIFSSGLHVKSAQEPCPACSGRLVKRRDDTPETLRLRLQEYREKTQPLLGYYEQRGILSRVDSARTPDIVFGSIQTILEQQ